MKTKAVLFTMLLFLIFVAAQGQDYLRPSTDPSFERAQMTLMALWDYNEDITIDGIADESFWEHLEPHELTYDVTNAWWSEGSKPIDPKYKESGDYHLSWRAAMDEEFLYIFCEIIDDDLQSRSMHNGDNTWANDNIQLSFCFSEVCCPGDWCGFDYYAVVIILADLNEQTGDSLPTMGSPWSMADPEPYQPLGYKSRTVATPAGYNIEARIPFALILPSGDGRYGSYNDNDEWVDIVITDLKPFLFDITASDRDEGKVGPNGDTRHFIANWSANWNRNWGFTEGYGIISVQAWEPPSLTGLTTDNDQPLILYPNPANDALMISNIPQNSSVSIYDLQGRLMLKTMAASGNPTIDVGALSRGVYILKISNTNAESVLKFVKH
jgi:hypothetical protein